MSARYPNFFCRTPALKPAFRAAGTYSEVVSGGGNATPSLPTNVAGDLFLAVGVGYLSGITPPAGWTQQVDTYVLGGSGAQHGYIWTRNTRSTGGESGNPSFAIDDRGACQIHTFSRVAVSSFFTTHTFNDNLAGANTNPTLPLAATTLTMLASSGYSTTASVTIGGSPSGGTWGLLAQAFGSGDIFFHHLQAATGAPGSISGGTTTVGGTNQWQFAAFSLSG